MVVIAWLETGIVCIWVTAWNCMHILHTLHLACTYIRALCTHLHFTHMYIIYTHVHYVHTCIICVCILSILYVSCTELCKSCIFHVHYVFFMYIMYCSRTCLYFRGVYHLVALFLQKISVYSKHERRVLILEVLGETCFLFRHDG